jgi:hypothetical protein
MCKISNEAVAGVWPVDLGEAAITEVWPSISATRLGQALGKPYALPFPLGLLFGILTLPLVLGLFAYTRTWRYTLTTTRVRVRAGPKGKDKAEAKLSEIEQVRIIQRPGQAFYRAADLELVGGDRVLLHLPGVPNPEPFRRNILQARDALVLVATCRQAQESLAAAG